MLYVCVTQTAEMTHNALVKWHQPAQCIDWKAPVPLSLKVEECNMWLFNPGVPIQILGLRYNGAIAVMGCTGARCSRPTGADQRMSLSPVQLRPILLLCICRIY